MRSSRSELRVSFTQSEEMKSKRSSVDDDADAESDQDDEDYSDLTERIASKWAIRLQGDGNSKKDVRVATAASTDLRSRLAVTEQALAADAADASFASALNDSTSSTDSTVSAAEARRRKLFPNSKRSETLAQHAAARAMENKQRSPIVVKLRSELQASMAPTATATAAAPFRKPFGLSNGQPTATSSTAGPINPLHKAYIPPTSVRPLVGLPSSTAAAPGQQQSSARNLFMHFLAGGLKAPKIRQQ